MTAVEASVLINEDHYNNKWPNIFYRNYIHAHFLRIMLTWQSMNSKLA